MISVQKYECNNSCLADSIMQLRRCDKQLLRDGKNIVGKEEL